MAGVTEKKATGADAETLRAAEMRAVAAEAETARAAEMTAAAEAETVRAAEITAAAEAGRRQAAGMTAAAEEPGDSVDRHVARWAAFWKDDPRFVPEVEGALVRIYDIRKRSQRADVAAFAGSPDVTLEDYKTLHALMIRPDATEATQAQLADATHVTRAAMTSRLDRLVDAGLVTRDVDPADRRRVLIRPTAAGRTAWDKHIFEGMARDQEMLSALSADELRQLNALLRKVMRSLE